MAEVRAVGDINNGVRDVSPDFSSLFSSTSASVDRCSFASTSSDLSQHLSGPDLEHAHSNKLALQNNNSFFTHKVEKAKVLVDDHNEGSFQALDSARSFFSVALKECQERRSRSEVVTKNIERRRPVSLDLNSSTVNVVGSSPRLVTMKKSSVSCRKLGNFPSPGTPNYRHGNVVVGVNKGWSSERVPLPTNVNGRALLPLSNGRALPSKWEDAERWICSPVGGGRRSSCQQQPLRRPKSKSGPLGPPGVAYHAMYSPAGPMYDGGNLSCHMVGSPFSSGVMMVDGLSLRTTGYGGGGGGGGVGVASINNSVEPCIARSASVHGCTDLVCQAPLNNSQDKGDEVKVAMTFGTCAISRRDMATQMSPGDSCPSSLRSSPPSILPIMEKKSFSSSQSEVRDVQIDERVTVTRWSTKYKGRITGKGSEDVDKWKLKAVEPCSPAWEVVDTVKSISRVRREEAKITQWENLQKVKAEAAIRKLEMKLEKKRSSSMEKIMKKLRSAQKKAKEMRTSVLANQATQVSKTSTNAISFRRTQQMGSLSGCFTCHAF